MSGIGQELPYEATGAAVGVFIYSSICFTLSAALLLAAIAHRESKSYVALLAFFTSLSTLASMAQQLHTFLRWKSIKLAQFDYVKENAGNPELSIAGPSVGIDIVLFYIQFYSYNVESILVMSWCAQLANSVYRLQISNAANRYGSTTAKVSAVVLPIMQVTLMRTKVVQGNLTVFYFLANMTMGVCLAAGIVLLLAILARYVATRTETSWHVRYADRSTVDQDPWPSNSLASFSSSVGPPLHQKSIYDNWLVIRFAIAFAGLSAFQFIVILQEISFAMQNSKTSEDDTVSLKASHAIGDIEGFIPGVSASLLAFVVFGTTKAFREYFYRKLVPRSIRRRIRRRSGRSPTIAIMQPPPAPRRPPRPSMLPLSPTAWTPGSNGMDCFELDGAESGLGTGMTRSVHELATPTPTHSTFSMQKHVEDDDFRPILNIKAQRI